MNRFRLIVGAALFVLISGCSSVEQGNSIVLESTPVNPLKVKDVLVATIIDAPMPSVGSRKSEVEQDIVLKYGEIFRQSESLVIARFKTQGSQLESVYEYCNLEYHFFNSKFSAGPFVVDECSSLVINGAKQK